MKAPSFTRKHYIEIGNIMKEHATGNTQLVEAMADIFQSDNELFDRARFINHCKGA